MIMIAMLAGSGPMQYSAGHDGRMSVWPAPGRDWKWLFLSGNEAAPPCCVPPPGKWEPRTPALVQHRRLTAFSRGLLRITS